MKNLLLALLWISLAGGISFSMVAEFPTSRYSGSFGFDSDQDGHQNLIFPRRDPPNSIQFWEHIGYDKYFLEDSATAPRWVGSISDIGFLDADSLVDVVVTHNGTKRLYIYESPTQHSHPTNVVWQDSIFTNISGGKITDLDQDGIKEILFRYYDMNANVRHTCVYENTGDNEYTLVWQDTVRKSAYFINGDFDQDGKLEFISGIERRVYVWECVGDNDYQFIFEDTLPRSGNDDVFCGHDMDGNGRPEFLFTAVYPFFRRVYLYCYEAIGDNCYDYFLIDSIINLPLLAEYVGKSACGDIDADGIEEIIWSSENQWHIYKAFGVHGYQRIYSSTWSNLREITRMNRYDLNGNGYPEVIEAWIDDGYIAPEGTTLWEIEGVRLHRPNGGEVLHPGEQCLITWEKFDPPGADSFALFYSLDNGFNYDTIVMGLDRNDTSYLWTVPNTLSDSCIVMIWAYGPPRPGEQEPRGTAWDFSDSVFSISHVGIKTDMRCQIGNVGLRILQNPLFSDNLKIQYALPRHSKVKLVIYNVLGQVEEVLVDGEKSMGLYVAEPKKSLPAGVHFVKLITDKKTITEKCVILK